MYKNQQTPLVFFVNGKKVIENNPDPEWTLIYYLRSKLTLCGTKLGCGEGGCGACTVMVSKYDRKVNKVSHLAINACLAPVCSMHGLAVTTVEGIGSTKTKLHPVQQAIAKSHGSQCGFCTPGIVMSMYALVRNSRKKPNFKNLETTFQGNLCRCTGYRPILQGFMALTEEWEWASTQNINGNNTCSMGKQCCKLQSCDNEYDIVDCFQHDCSQELIFPPELKLHNELDKQCLIFRGKEVTWYRPTDLDNLLNLKHNFPEAKIVVGNTEIGVETKFRNLTYPIIICPILIDEMTTVTIEKCGLKVGAAVTLQNMLDAINAMIKSELEYRTRVFVSIAEMLHWFGGQQIRNVASIGGNIMTGSPISDLNPILIAAKVELELNSVSTGKRKIIMDEHFFTGYRCNVVREDEVLISVKIPFSTKHQHFIAYKQSRRQDDDIAIVNSAINAIFKPGTNIIEKIEIAFGGMGPTIIVPKKTCMNLINQPWNEDTLNNAYALLTDDLPLSTNAPGGMIQYRKSLTLSFFFKAYLEILHKLNLDCLTIRNEINENFGNSVGKLLSHIPKASQYYQIISPTEKVNSIGQPLPHLSSFKQATGEAIYCDDIPCHQCELHLAFVLSTRPYAKFEVDASDALNAEGVHLFLSAKDIQNDKNSFDGPNTESYFAPGITMFHGQILGAIVANSRSLARKAARKVKVTYSDLHPVIISIEDAIKENSYFGTPIVLKKGDVDKMFADAPNIIEGDCRNGAQEHFYLEPHAAIATPKNEDGEMEIICTAQHPMAISKAVASILNVAENKIITKVKRLGGAFGGKEYPILYLSVATAVAASKLGVPVRCVLERDEDMSITGARHPYYIKYKCAFDESGKIFACEAYLYCNAGYATTISNYVLEQSVIKFGGAYNIPNVRLTGHLCKTNLPSNTAFRAFGAPQSFLPVEFMIREIAEHLNKDVVDVMKANLYQDGDITVIGQKLEHVTTERCLLECLESSRFVQRRKEIDSYNSKNRWKKRGISIVPLMYGIGFSFKPLHQGAALIHVYTDGSVLLSHAGVEMGQGLHTKIVQIASQVLEISTDKIHVSDTSTDKVPNGVQTAASISCDLQGPAVVEACNIINERLKSYKLSNPKGCWEDWVLEAYKDRVSLSTTGFYKFSYQNYNTNTEEFLPFMYFTNGAGCSEVEIDCLTGDHQVVRTDIVMDVGKSLNPAIDVGQIEGAFMQGYGLYMIEELMYGPNGALLTKGPGAYKLPGFGNVPLELNVSLLKEAPNPRAIYSSKAIGEPPLLLASSVLFAVREAIKSARADSGVSKTGFKLYSPVTSAKIRMTCEDHLTTKLPKMDAEDGTPWNVIP